MNKFSTEQQQRIVDLLSPSINETRIKIETCTNHIFQLKNILGLKNGDLRKAEEKISKLEDGIRLDESIINLVFDTNNSEEDTNPSDNGSEGNNSNDNNTEENISNKSTEEKNSINANTEENKSCGKENISIESTEEINHNEEVILPDADSNKKTSDDDNKKSNINQELKEAIQKKEALSIKKGESEIHKDTLNFYETESISIKNKAHLFNELNHEGIKKATNILNKFLSEDKANHKLYLVGSQPYNNNIEKYKKAINSLLKNNEFLIPNKMPRKPLLSEINAIG